MFTVIAIVGLVVFTAAIGLVWRAGSSRVSAAPSSDRVPARFIDQSVSLTLLQVSAPLCSYCGAMRGILGDIASREPRTAHIEFDVSEVAELIERFGIRQTPTTLLVAASGDVLARLSGPTPQAVVRTEVQTALDELERRSDEYLI